MTQKIRLTLPNWTADNVILLNVRLNKHTLIRMILDTGARYTIITPETARRLGLDLESARRIPVATASQLEMAVLVTIDQVDVAGFALNDIETAVMGLPAALGVDGLLGISFLRHCRLVLDIPARSVEFVA